MLFRSEVNAESQLGGVRFRHHHRVSYQSGMRYHLDDTGFQQLVGLGDDELELFLALLSQNLLHGAGIRVYRQLVLDHLPWYAG